VPMTIAFQGGLNINLEIEIDDRAKHRCAHVENHNRIGEHGRLHSAETSEEGMRTGARWYPYRQSLVRDRAEQRDRNKTMQNEKRRCHSLYRRDVK
jgi:hypothetical protein